LVLGGAVKEFKRAGKTRSGGGPEARIGRSSRRKAPFGIRDC